MFALNANFNSNAFYGTNADYVVLYDSWMAQDPDYMKRCETAFPFKVIWKNRDDFSGCYHNSKYAIAQSLKDEYDAICLIDADLFICCDTRPYFEQAHYDKKFLTGTHVWSGGDVNAMLWGQPEKVVDRILCHLADFPVFMDPKAGEPFFKQWKFNTEDGVVGSEWQHPLVAFNRAIVKHFTRDQVIGLDGFLWVCDNNFWGVHYKEGIDENGRICMTTDVYGKPQQAMALHNKWWKVGRTSGEFIPSWGKTDNNPGLVSCLDIGQDNFNNIKDFMAKFNAMTPATQRDDYLKEKIDWRKYLSEYTGKEQ
jgi:hypothetical protein